MATNERVAKIADSIRVFKDFPKPGVNFRDVFSLTKDPQLFSECIQLLIEHVRVNHPQAEVIAGLDSRGFIIGPMIAHSLKLPFVPIRKHGKLPGETYKAAYSLEYGEDCLEIQKDACAAGQKVIIVDDLIATGGTMKAAVDLVRQCGGVVVECLLIIELVWLKGCEKVNAPTWSLISFSD